ncbi:hypothetical protein [Burkholderia pseudomultivorans]|uniref:hypothetical protein n=1 Tax=Burkholderia pseudomultivorans TaxID=1207504 RepID=UPI002870A2D7|nr:hypothetical protein [Burkholderia pseudomultivorans]
MLTLRRSPHTDPTEYANHLDNLGIVIRLFKSNNGADMYWYDVVKRDLRHARNAIQILRTRQGQFVPGTLIADPNYWNTRILSIRDLAQRHNYLPLVLEADELIAEIKRLQN